ncbi:hypothetical protein HUU62_04375 [Rhodoferax sp. 4810]|nr:hypothetical protein [Rhodoferax jenense]
MITLELTPQQVQSLGLCLTKAPVAYEIVHPLIVEINEQIARQQPKPQDKSP